MDDVVEKYNNTYNRTIKMEPVDVKSKTCINFNKEINYKDPKFKVGDCVRISKDKTQKVTFQIGLKTFLLLKKFKILCHGHI